VDHSLSTMSPVNPQLRQEGLSNIQRFLSREATLCYSSGQLSDLHILTSEGPVFCHASVLVPHSSLLRLILGTYSSFPGLVHTVVVPLERETVKNIMKIIYTGKVTLASQADANEVLSGLNMLGINLPGLEWSLADELGIHTFTSLCSNDRDECRMSTNAVVDTSLEVNNNISPPPVSNSVPQHTSSMDTSPAQSPSAVPVVPCPRQQLQECPPHFKCPTCGKRFKHKKYLEIHQVDLNKVNENPNQLSATDKDANNVENKPPVSGVAKATVSCSQCQEPLPSEWYRNPTRHNCPYLTQNCSKCSTAVPSSWYLSPSRHGCPAVDSTTSGQEAPKNKKRSRKRKRPSSRSRSPSRCLQLPNGDNVSNIQEQTSEKMDIVRYRKVLQVKPSSVRMCPVHNCSWQGKTAWDMKNHITSSHNGAQLGTEFSTGEILCSRCGKIIPNLQKQQEHVALEHDVDCAEKLLAEEADMVKVIDDGDNKDKAGSEQVQSHSSLQHIVETPGYREIVKRPRPCYSNRGTEDISDEAMLSRHAKYEKEEKQRKRWDVQNSRLEEILKKLRKKEKEDCMFSQDKDITELWVGDGPAPLKLPDAKVVLRK